MKSSPIILIGLDSADPDLILKWSSEGYLPAISSLIKRGCWGKLKSTADISSGSLWPTFFTGTSPAKHGCYFGHMQLKSGTYRIYKRDADQIKRNPFWLWLSRAGKRVAICDIPQTYPIEGLNGIQITGWGVESPHWKLSSWPPELIGDLISRIGTHPLSRWYQTKPEKMSDYKDLYQKLILGIARKGLITSSLLEGGPWDFFLMMYSEPHWAGHLLWHLLDVKHSAYSHEIARGLKDVIRNIYAKIDSNISKLIETFPDSTFLIFSPAGIENNHSGIHLLPDILKRLGIMGRNSGSGHRFGLISVAVEKISRLMPHNRWGPYTLKKLEELIPSELIEVTKRVVPENMWANMARLLLTLGNEWRWSRAFCVPNDFSGAIRINLRGREPNGIVEPGQEYDKLCDELIRELKSLVNPDDGGKAVNEVLRVDKLYQGENIRDLPDLLVVWKRDTPIKALYSPRVGTVAGENPDKRMGAHKPEGILIASGSQIGSSKTFGGGHIMDIAPTILYLMGCPIPRDMDGKVITGVIDEGVKANRSISYS
jgi:predicted AlkP superfamily phosphohydrolase/phosphomutase